MHGDTAEEVVARAKEELIKNGEAKPEKVIGITIEGENHSWDKIPKTQSATFVINWDVGYKLLLRDGSTVYFMSDGKTRNYGWRWERELPWTQATEDALLRAT